VVSVAGAPRHGMAQLSPADQDVASLIQAAWDGNAAEVERLVARGVDPCKPLLTLLERLAMVRALVALLDLPLTSDVFGQAHKVQRTALHAAAERGHREIVEMLLLHAPVDCRTQVLMGKTL
jgi:ankyrin repeat protein